MHVLGFRITNPQPLLVLQLSNSETSPGGGLQSRNKMQRKVTQSLKFLGLLEELGRIPGFPTARQRLHQLAASAAQTFLLLAVPRVRWLSLGLELSWPTLRVTISVSPISTLLNTARSIPVYLGFPSSQFQLLQP